MARARSSSTTAEHAALLLLSLSLVAVQGIVPSGDVQHLLVTAMAYLTLLLALRLSRPRPDVYRAIAGPGAIIVVVSTMRTLTGEADDAAARFMNAALVLIGPAAIAIGIVRDLRESGEVELRSVMGVLSLYLLLGVLFAFVYGALDRVGSGPFFADGEPATAAKALYFSFVTLATVGYGDVVARTDAGHTLAIFEALLGQIYLVTVVSVIVSNLGRAPRAGRLAPDEGPPSGPSR